MQRIEPGNVGKTNNSSRIEALRKLWSRWTKGISSLRTTKVAPSPDHQPAPSLDHQPAPSPEPQPASRNDELQFSNLDLPGCAFSDATFEGRTFSNCKLQNSDFSRSTLNKATFDNCNLSGVSFKDCDLSGVSFKDCDLRGVSFEGLDLTNVTFENCKLGNTNFKDAKLHHVRINRSDLSNANFENALVALSTLENTNFTNASLENSKFIYNLLDHTKMDGANLKDAVITFIDGRDTLTVAGQSLSKDDIKSMGVYIPDNYAHFRKQLLSDPNFKLTQEALNTMQRLEGLDLRGQDLSNLNLRQDQVNGVIFGSKEIKELKVDGKTVTKEQLKKWGAIILEPVWVSDGPGLMENSGLSAVFPGLVGNNSGLRAEFCYVTRDGNIRVRREVNEV